MNEPLMSTEGTAVPRAELPEMGATVGFATLAFHFRYVMREQFMSDSAVATDRLSRVLRAIRPVVTEDSVLSIRMGKLLYTQQLQSNVHSGWWEALQSTRVVEGKTALRTRLDAFVPLDRMFVISVTGAVSGQLDAWSRRVEAVAGDRFVFACEPVPTSQAHRNLYFGGNAWLVGQLHGASRWEPLWESVEYGPELGARLRRMGLEVPDLYADPSAEDARILARLRESQPGLLLSRQQPTVSNDTEELRHDN